jgi:16S rRNA (guanine1516-N2)-methyltransferase
MIHIAAVGYEHEELRDKAQTLASQLNFVLDKNANTCLFFTESKLTLKVPGFSLLFPEFNASFWNKRKQEGKKQGLVRACKPIPGLKIIDATAGWGRDSAVLASFGATVLMLERDPIMAVLLADALKRNKEQRNLSFHSGDAHFFLNALKKQDYPDVIYIDPMHPERNKSALVKKDMQILQQMIGNDEDALSLIELARKRVKQRVVVKWPQKTKALLSPNSCIEGKTVRFDIYLPVIQIP